MHCLRAALPTATKHPQQHQRQKGENPTKSLLFSFSQICLGMTFWVLPAVAVFTPNEVLAAERIYVSYGPLEFSLPISSLVAYAKEGKIDAELAAYADYVDGKQMEQLQKLLLTRIDVTTVAVSQFLYSPQGEILLTRLGEIMG